jgi:hypothetical protein
MHPLILTVVSMHDKLFSRDRTQSEAARHILSGAFVSFYLWMRMSLTMDEAPNSRQGEGGMSLEKQPSGFLRVASWLS